MALSHSPSVITSGLVLYLDAANRRSYPGSGTTWFDLSGNGNNGTLTNGPTFGSGNSGHIIYDGIDDLVNTNYATQGMSEFSTDIVFRTTTTYNTSSYYNCPSICGTAQGSGTSGDWLVAVKAGFLVSYDELNNSNNNTDLNYYVSDNKWYFLQVTKTVSGVITYYLNGSVIRQIFGRTNQLRTSSTSSTIYGTNWMVGSAFWTEPEYRNFQGQIAFNLLYNRSLSYAEVLQNFNALRGRFGI